jgi:hypothetical protein
MIQGYLVLAERIRKELKDLEHVVDRVEKATQMARHRPEDQEFLIDSAALNLHDLYSGMERIFQQIAATVDGSVPSGRDWHRDLLRQMTVEVVNVRPPVLSNGAAQALDVFLRFRHIVRNVYTFSLDSGRVIRLVDQLRPAFSDDEAELLHFADILEVVGKD